MTDHPENAAAPDFENLAPHLIEHLQEETRTCLAFSDSCALHLTESVNRLTSTLLLCASALIGFGSGGSSASYTTAAIAMGLHLLAATAYLTWFGKRTKAIPVQGSEPHSLIKNDVLAFPANQIILQNLRKKQQKILALREGNARVGRFYNRALTLALLSPASFILSWWITTP